MADFCKDCHNEMFGEDCKCDAEGLCKEGEKVGILCEGCGDYIWVDHNGKKVKEEELK